MSEENTPQEPPQEAAPQEAAAPPEQPTEESSNVIEFNTGLGTTKFDLTDPEDIKALQGLAEEGLGGRAAKEEAKRIQEATKNEREQLEQFRRHLDQNPGLRAAFVNSVQTGKDIQASGEGDDVALDDPSDSDVRNTLSAVQQELQHLRSVQATREERDKQKELEAQIDRALDKHAGWMKGKDSMRELAKGMAALQAEKAKVDPGVAAIQVSKALADGLNVDRQTQYEQIVRQRESAATVRPDQGAPTPTDPKSYNRDEWTNQNRGKVRARIADFLAQRRQKA